VTTALYVIKLPTNIAAGFRMLEVAAAWTDT
jgi:hypothetical protein